MFEPWQGPALTTILHRQQLGYMRNYLDIFLAPCQAGAIFRYLFPGPRVHHTAGLVQETNYHHTSLHPLGGLVGYLF